MWSVNEHSAPECVLERSPCVMSAEASVRAWIRNHKVCWEMWPDHASRDGRLERAGLQLSLLARAPSLGEDPGSKETYALYLKLSEIASKVLSNDAGDVWEPFDHSFRLRAGTGWAPEVELTIHIQEAGGPDRTRVKRIEEALGQLGVQPRVWLPGAERRTA